MDMYGADIFSLKGFCQKLLVEDAFWLQVSLFHGDFLPSMKRVVFRTVATTALGAAIGTAAFNLTDSRSRLYSCVVMPVMRKVDPEEAHKLSVYLASKGIAPVDKVKDSENLQTSFLGKTLSNPIGIAAGAIFIYIRI